MASLLDASNGVGNPGIYAAIPVLRARVAGL
jgi:hypothetical protein